MRTFGAELAESSRVLRRADLLRQLRKLRGRAAFRIEEQRRARVVGELRQARLTGIRVTVPVEALEARLAGLPGGRDRRGGVDRGAVRGGEGGGREALRARPGADGRLRALRGARREGGDVGMSEALVPASGACGGGCGCTRRAGSGPTCRPTTGPRRRSRRTSPPVTSRTRGRPLFQSVDRSGRLSGRPLAAGRAGDDQAAGGGSGTAGDDVLPHVSGDGDHGVPLERGGTLEHAQRIAGHSSPKTTKLYDRTADAVSLDEIERIVIQGTAAGRFPRTPATVRVVSSIVASNLVSPHGFAAARRSGSPKAVEPLLGVGVALVGRQPVPPCRFQAIPWHPAAELMRQAEVVLRPRVPLFGGAAVPERGLLVVLPNTRSCP